MTSSAIFQQMCPSEYRHTAEAGVLNQEFNSLLAQTGRLAYMNNVACFYG